MNGNSEKQPERFLDAESFSGTPDQAISFRSITLGHVRKISELAAKEFRGGFYKQEIVGQQVVKNWVEDSREAYNNAIDYLSDLLLPLYDEQAAAEVTMVDSELAKLKGLSGEAFASGKVVNRRKLFRALTKLLHRLKYLETERYEE